MAYQSDREGDVSIFWQPADGSGAAERLTKAAPVNRTHPSHGRQRPIRCSSACYKDGEHTLWALSLPDKTVARFGAVRSTVPINAAFSPDGRWIAYQSDQSGRITLYVQPVPPTGAVYPFVPRGNDVPHEPMWSPDSKELFYNPRAGGFEVVAVTTEPEFDLAIPPHSPGRFD